MGGKDSGTLGASYASNGDLIITTSSNRVLRWDFSEQSLVRLACKAIETSLGSMDKLNSSPDLLKASLQARKACIEVRASRNGWQALPLMLVKKITHQINALAMANRRQAYADKIKYKQKFNQ
jgi:hypothetical protein